MADRVNLSALAGLLLEGGLFSVEDTAELLSLPRFIVQQISNERASRPMLPSFRITSHMVDTETGRPFGSDRSINQLTSLVAREIETIGDPGASDEQRIRSTVRIASAYLALAIRVRAQAEIGLRQFVQRRRS